MSSGWRLSGLVSQLAGRVMGLQEAVLGTHPVACPGQIPRRRGSQTGMLPLATDWALPLSQPCLVPSPGSPDGSSEKKSRTGPKGQRSGCPGEQKGGAEPQGIPHGDGRRQKEGMRTAETQRLTGSCRGLRLNPGTERQDGDAESGRERLREASRGRKLHRVLSRRQPKS